MAGAIRAVVGAGVVVVASIVMRSQKHVSDQTPFRAIHAAIRSFAPGASGDWSAGRHRLSARDPFVVPV
jgi:hypothetical protein